MYSKFYQAPYYSAQTLDKTVYPEDIQCVVDPNEQNVGGIFISNIEAAQNIKTLRRNNIKAVLTAAKGAQINHPKHEIPHYKYIPGEDHQQFDLSKYFHDCASFIDQTLSETNILVHCMAGISRSVSLVLAYLIKHKGHTYESAYSAVKSRRKIIHPNQGFISQLKQFQREIKKSSNNYESRRCDSPTRSKYESPSKIDLSRYESKRTYDYETVKTAKYTQNQPNLRESTLNLPKNRNISFNELKYSQSKLQPAYDNQEELDRKIAEIRKKYDSIVCKTNTVTPPTKYGRIKHANSYYENNQNKRSAQYSTKYESLNYDLKKPRFYQSPMGKYSQNPQQHPLEPRNKLRKTITMYEPENKYIYSNY